MAEPTYPDAYIKQGRILCIKTDDELPSYEGLVLVGLAGRYCVMNTTLAPDIEPGRRWELVQWGATLAIMEVKKFLAERKLV